MNTLQTLIAARALIDTPEKWERHCIHTAIAAAARYEFGLTIKTLRHFATVNGINANGRHHIWDWNDAPGRKHAEVLAAFDRAIEAATDISVFTAMLTPNSSGMALESPSHPGTAPVVLEDAAGNILDPVTGEGEV